MKNFSLDLTKIKRQIIDTAYKWLLFFVIPGIIISLLSIKTTGIRLPQIFFFLSCILFFSIYFFKNKLSNTFLIIFYVSVFFLYGISSLYSYGITASGILSLIIAIVSASFLLNQKTTYLLAFSSIFLLLFFAVVYSLEWMTIKHDIIAYTHSYYFWYTVIIETAFILFIIARFSRVYFLLLINEKELLKKNHDLHELNHELKEEIENRKQLEKVIEEKYKSLFESSSDVEIIIKDERFVDCNERTVKLFQAKSKYDLLGKHFSELSPTLQPNGTKSIEMALKVKKTVLSGNNQLYEWRHRKLNGELFDAEISVGIIDFKKEIFHARYRNITEKKKAEEALKESEARNKIIVNNLPVVVHKSNASGGLIFISENVKNVLGFSAEEMMSDINKYWFERVYPLDLQRIMASYQNIFENNKPFNHEYRYKTKSNNWIWLNDFANVIQEKSGETFVLGAFHDITPRKMAENAHIESEERYRLLSDATFEAIVIHENGKIYDFNKQFVNLLDYTVDELKESNLENYIYHEDINTLKKKLNELVGSDIIIRAVTKKGDILYLESHAKEIKISDKKYSLVVFKNITPYKNIELSLRESDENFRNIFNTVTDAIFIIDFQDKILQQNNTAINELGYKKTDYSKMQVQSLFCAKTIINISKIKKANNPSIQKTFEAEIKIKSNAKIPVETSIKKINFYGKEALIVISRNISERKQFQHKLYNTMIEAEEKERERYAKELHDGLGPILSTCKIYFHSLNSIEDKIKKQEHATRAGELLEDALRSIKEISNQLSPHILRNYGLLQALDAFISRLKAITGISFIVRANFENRLPEIIEFTLYRILLELINNTIKYAEASEVKIVINKNKNELFIKFSDNGKGFDYEKIKKMNKGIGLLNLGNRIKKLDGAYDYKSSPGKGVRMNIFLNISL